jgi:predicted DNA-binding protein with PD1-like motif
MIRLERGEEVVSALTAFAVDTALGSGFVTGLGAICNVELGYFDLSTKEYVRGKFDGDYELVSFIANISILDGRPFLHAHITMSDRNCRPLAGHLHSARIAVTGEFLVVSTGTRVERKPDDETGLNLLEL